MSLGIVERSEKFSASVKIFLSEPHWPDNTVQFHLNADGIYVYVAKVFYSDSVLFWLHLVWSDSGET